MKKVLATALVLSLSVAVLTSPALADNQEKEQVQNNVFVERVQAPEQETMEAVIKEIHDHEWIVTDQAGKEYTVPILGFEQLEDYKKLNPTVGTKVTLKGNSIHLADGPIKFFHTIEAVMEGEATEISEKVQVFKFGSKEGVIELNKEDILKTTMDKEAGAIKVVKGIPVEEGMNLTKKDFTELSEKVKVFKLGSKEGVIELNKEDILKTTMDKEVGTINVVRGIPAEEGMNLTEKDFVKELKGDLFMAHEITVDGMTLKLPMVEIAVPALPATEKASE